MPTLDLRKRTNISEGGLAQHSAAPTINRDLFCTCDARGSFTRQNLASDLQVLGWAILGSNQ
jgi:hypothetical protein